MEFRGRQVLVIGGTSGIGRASALAFARSGAHVTATGRIGDAGGGKAHEPGLSVLVRALDISDMNEVEAFAAGFDHIDVLVITAGVTHFAPTTYEQPEAFRYTVDVNLTGTFFALKALAPKVRDGGAIVLTTTVLAKSYFFGATALSASRAGLAVALRTFAIELAPRGVRVNAVSLGPIETAAWDKVRASEEDRAGVRAKVPLGRLGRPEEVASAVLFLASENATYITGHELAVDGGWGCA